MTNPSIEALAAGLSEAQRRAIVSSKPIMDARILVPAYVSRQKWPDDLTDKFSVAFRRLTPLGLALRAHLKGQPHG